MIEFDVSHIFVPSQHLPELATMVFLFVTKFFFVLIFFEKLNPHAGVDGINMIRLI